jgi:predicted phage gp36 major capsid-like protein
MSDSFGIRDWIAKVEELERELAEALKANRELNAECMKEAVRADKFERELAAIKATCDDYRIQACSMAAERDAWKAKFIKANKDYGCELRDPYGTIWEHAEELRKERDAFVNLLDPVDGNVVSAMVRLRDLLAVSPSHTERIICPSCKREQVATVEHKWPFYSYVHFCECGYTIMESEWERVKVKQ